MSAPLPTRRMQTTHDCQIFDHHQWHPTFTVGEYLCMRCGAKYYCPLCTTSIPKGARARFCPSHRAEQEARDQAETSEHEQLIKRLGTAIGKYWVTKRSPVHVAEALECLGGNGYVEESIMPRLYREAPLNSIWEGSGNVNTLDVLRALAKERHALEHFFAELAPACKADPRLDTAVTHLQRQLTDTEALEWRARYLVEQMALVFQGALLVQHGYPAVADTFCATRLAGSWGRAFGTLPRGTDAVAILERSRPRREHAS